MMTEGDMEKFEKEFRQELSRFEIFGVRVLFAFQCIRCGRTMDSILDVSAHMKVCDGKIR